MNFNAYVTGRLWYYITYSSADSPLAITTKYKLKYYILFLRKYPLISMPKGRGINIFCRMTKNWKH